MSDTIGRRLTILRELRHYSQEDVARMIGVSKKTISHYEKNYREPSGTMLVRLASVFHVSVDYILGIDAKEYLDITKLNSREVGIVKELVEILSERKKK